MTQTALTNTTSNTEQVSNASPGGTQIGQSSDLISFYGATPIAQQTGTGGAPVTTTPTSSSPYGFATITQAQQVLNAMLALQKLGLIS